MRRPRSNPAASRTGRAIQTRYSTQDAPRGARHERYRPACCDRLGHRKAGVDAASRVGWLDHRAERAVRSDCPHFVLADVAGDTQEGLIRCCAASAVPAPDWHSLIRCSQNTIAGTTFAITAVACRRKILTAGDDAYESPVASADTGLVLRNVYLARVTSVVLFFLFDRRGRFLDAAGGYGIFTRRCGTLASTITGRTSCRPVPHRTGLRGGGGAGRALYGSHRLRSDGASR